jgi:hypothetical protein
MRETQGILMIMGSWGQEFGFARMAQEWGRHG